MELQITEEMIEAIIERKIDDVLDDETIEERVNGIIDYQLRQKIDRMIEAELKERAEALTVDTVEALLDRKTVYDDGWGKREEHATLADYYKATLKKSLASYNMDRTIREVVSERVDREVEAKKARIAEIVAAEIESEVRDD